MKFSILVNGTRRTVEEDADTPLLWVLRDDLQLVGTKYGCGIAACGACTVHLDGVAARSCATPISAVGDATIVTIEGIGETDWGRRVKDAWLELDVMQCGYCQAGQVMTAIALLAKTPQPTDPDIDTAMQGNLCRCCTYTRIRAAIKRAAGLPETDSREGRS